LKLKNAGRWGAFSYMKERGGVRDKKGEDRSKASSPQECAKFISESRDGSRRKKMGTKKKKVHN